MDLDRLNRADRQAAARELRACCASDAWVESMVGRRPFRDTDHLLTAASDAWWVLGEEDWLQAFAAHPRIGERPVGDDRHAAWSRREQAGMEAADHATVTALSEANQEYERRFGFGFLVCAAGLEAADLLATLRSRLDRDPDEEFLTAAGEQEKITALRLRRLLGVD